MTQPSLFDPSGRPANISAYCRAEARERSHKTTGTVARVEATFKNHPEGITADRVAEILGLILNTARRCVFDLAAEGSLHPIGIGQSCYNNPQTIYVHNNFKGQHLEAIRAHALKEQERAERNAK